MAHYIDGFILPVPTDKLDIYKKVVQKIAGIWKEYGALDYKEFVSDNTGLEGTRSFSDAAEAAKNESVIFGWVTFEDREARDRINEQVANDPRMPDLTRPITETTPPVFDPERMVYGGFRLL